MDRVTPHILWEGWNTEWENSPLSFIDRLTQATRNYRLAQEKQRELKSAIALIHKELEGININKESIDAAFPDWRNAPAATQEMEIKDLGIAWNNLNTQASGLKQSISSTADQMARLQKDLTGFYAANPTLDEERITVLSAWSGSRIEALRASLQTLKRGRSSCIDLLSSGHRTSGRAHQPEARNRRKRKPRNPGCTHRESRRKITAGNQSIGQQKLRLEENTRNIDRIKEEKERADRLREEYLKWDRLCRHFGDERGKNFRNIAQSFVLKELLAGANFYLQRLTDRYELECQAGSLTILLRDFHQGGSARPACTLSGGESFLVSLSLALGLSSLSRQSLSVDTLFIDEGFGTLSSDYLNTVMDTLEKLHQMGGKKVGIISHVEGLKERIKTQIQVRRIDSSRSEIEVVNTL